MENLIVSSMREYSLSYLHIRTNSPQLVRTNIIEDIEELAKESNLIIIQGSEGIGKTTTLLQFAEAHLFDCFTYFINSAYGQSYRQEYILEDLGRQLIFHNNAEINNDEVLIDEGLFNSLLLELMKKSSKKGKRIYFVIDGLDQIEKSSIELIKPIDLSVSCNTVI